MEISMEVLQKTKNRTAIKFCYTAPGYMYLKRSKSAYNRDTCTPMLIQDYSHGQVMELA
jgi:hypothetical protein